MEFVLLDGKIIDRDKIEAATIQHLWDASDGDYDFCGITINDNDKIEVYGAEGTFDDIEELLEKIGDAVTDLYVIEYWDGNNWKIDIIEGVLTTFEGEIEELEKPNPAFYFKHKITDTEDGMIYYTEESNMSGSISPYYFIVE